MKKMCFVSAAALAAAAGAASAQITSVGPFTGPYTESFETQTSGAFIQCIAGRVFNNTADLCTTPGAGTLITTGWSFDCSIFPHSGGHFYGSANGSTNITFDAAVGQFGGYFGSNGNSNIAQGAAVTFYDASNNVIGTSSITFSPCGTWAWAGWQSTVPIKVVNISGNGYGGPFVDMDDLEYGFGNLPTGACCLPNGQCVANTSSGCSAQGGTYHGDGSLCINVNCPPPPSGSCCLSGGVCNFTSQFNCATLHGVFGGVGVTCAQANCPTQYYYDDGTIENCLGPAAAAGIGFVNEFTCVSGADKITQIEIAFGCYAALNGLPITVVLESDPNADGDPDDAQVITSLPGVISGASPVFPIPTATWVVFDITDTVIPVGNNFFAGFVMNNAPVGQYPGAFDTSYAAGHSWWGYNTTGTFDPNNWGATNASTELTALGYPGNWLIRADAAPSSAAACYANCDHSTTQPCLNVLDFGCFLNQFAAGATYANCDNSTTPPVLNVLDFGCFLNKFAAGCSNC